jgi:YfiH family protein
MHAPTPKLTPIESPALATEGIVHAFFTRAGGVSTGIYSGLNTGIGSVDERENVLENRARAMRHLGVSPTNLAAPYQVHGTDTVVIEKAWPAGERPKADAVVTKTTRIAVAVGTADCGPVLIADANARVVGAAHAGWKGALAGILESAVEAMEGLGADRTRMVAALGPTISADAYEVGPDFVERFIAADADNNRFFRPSGRNGHALFDLPGYIVARLRGTGVAQVHDLGLCTYSDPERFFSYRRSVHRKEPDYGRLLSAIALIEN